ncbi:MAG TPA: DNA-processing protein DprA [Actinomycetota bacterium]|nr:DNA-processing protein DprA [Actinomycetota bacterium]
MARPRDRDALLVLASLEGIIPRDLHALAWREGSAAGCLRAIRRGAVGTDNDRTIAAAVRPDEVRKALAACGARARAPGDDEYPEALLHLADPPVCVFIRGQRLVPWPTAVTVVGSRTCTPYGHEIAEGIGAGLADAGVAVVSGAALGIDAASHEGALRAGGRTAAVLGSGIDVAYPRSNARLIDAIATDGQVLSEYPPGVPARPYRFPARNRLVAALGLAVVVVEGAEGSGSLITADFAQQLGRHILAVPGPVTAPQSAVPNELIRDLATLVRGPQDVLEAIGMAPVGATEDDDHPVPPGLSVEERAVLHRVSGASAAVEAVADAAGVSPARTLAALAALELRGLVASDGGRYRRTSSRSRRGW